ncbi:hypothetical protein BDV23DRAFT_16701 [Aspergillus alliaceus]|uniref:Uncharacterized protein n=1 Tax=Petromyces alliaceus TaxID=209559 RepID=A0A5N7CKS2_PETAA|nr:hypothetical protein BDV23DRAFT_16701 [Aspergillus alliaceus]
MLSLPVVGADIYPVFLETCTSRGRTVHLLSSVLEPLKVLQREQTTRIPPRDLLPRSDYSTFEAVYLFLSCWRTLQRNFGDVGGPRASAMIACVTAYITLRPLCPISPAFAEALNRQESVSQSCLASRNDSAFQQPTASEEAGSFIAYAWGEVVRQMFALQGSNGRSATRLVR